MHTLICVTVSLPPGVGGWLWLLLVALPGLFCLPFCTCNDIVYGFHGVMFTFDNFIEVFRVNTDSDFVFFARYDH